MDGCREVMENTLSDRLINELKSVRLSASHSGAVLLRPSLARESESPVLKFQCPRQAASLPRRRSRRSLPLLLKLEQLVDLEVGPDLSNIA